MIDRLTGWWPEAGAARLGVLRGEKDVVANEWFFNAHFMRDPVQPGSLGIEALAQLLQCAMRQRGLGDDFEHPEFEPVALGAVAGDARDPGSGNAAGQVERRECRRTRVARGIRSMALATG